MDTVTLLTQKKMEIWISAQIMQGNLDHQGATKKKQRKQASYLCNKSLCLKSKAKGLGEKKSI